MGDEEARLVSAARAGNDRAYATLVAQNQQAVRGFVRRFTGHWADADDISQEAFVTAWKRLDRFDGRASFRAWVCGIAYRRARDARRAHQSSVRRAIEWAESAPQRVDVTPREDRIALQNAMRGLSEYERAAVALCLGEGFSHAEAALIVNVPLGSLKTYLARGREKLLTLLRSADEKAP